MGLKLNFKTVIIFISLTLFGFLSIYFYAYKGHRDIASEEASFSLDANVLIQDFTLNVDTAGKKYTNQTLNIHGLVTLIDLTNNIIMMNEYISVQGIQNISTIKKNQKITIKGRLVGYDDLLNEIVMDQAIIQNIDTK
jgi:small nuclear ribonucleoprotein (snRNP)-like protein